LDTEEEPAPFPEATRCALLRGICLGALLAVPAALVAFAVDRTALALLGGAVTGLIFGFVTAPSLIVESIAARWRPSLDRELVVATGTSVLATIALVLALIQTVFTMIVFDGRSWESALRETQRAIHDASSGGAGIVVGIAFTFTLPFVSVAIGRLRERRLRSELAAALVCGLMTAVPTLTITRLLDLPWRYVGFGFGVPTVVNTLLVGFISCACRLADRLDRKIVARLSP
jgi:hypothetical protein